MEKGIDALTLLNALEENFKLNEVPLELKTCSHFSLSMFKVQLLGTHNSGVKPCFRQALQNSDGYLK